MTPDPSRLFPVFTNLFERILLAAEMLRRRERLEPVQVFCRPIDPPAAAFRRRRRRGRRV